MSTHPQNARDVGEALLGLGADDLDLRPGVLYRGGRIHGITEHAGIFEVASVLNLRPQKNPRRFGITYLRAPIDDRNDVYTLSHRNTRAWLNRALGLLAADEVAMPCYIHCTAGKDRTGVVIAMLLKLCGVPDALIVQEYRLSEGEIQPARLAAELAVIDDVTRYLRKVDVEALRHKLSP